MSLPSPFPRFPLTSAYDALIDVLTQDPLLKRTVKTWKTWDGGQDDADEPEPRQMPWVRLTPSPSQINFETIEDYKVPFNVLVEMATNTTDVRHMIDFWGAIVLALRGDKPFRDRTVRKYLQDAGNVTTYQVTYPGGAPVLYPPRRQGDKRRNPQVPTSLVSRTTVTLLVYVPA